MRYVSTTDAKQNFAALLDDAQRGPVVIRRQSRYQGSPYFGIANTPNRSAMGYKLVIVVFP